MQHLRPRIGDVGNGERALITMCVCLSKAREIARQHGVAGVSPEVCKLVSLGLEAHMGDLLRRAFVLARQRADIGRRLPGMEVRSLPPDLTGNCLIVPSRWTRYLKSPMDVWTVKMKSPL